MVGGDGGDGDDGDDGDGRWSLPQPHVLCRMGSCSLIVPPCPYDTWMHAVLSIPSILIAICICCKCLCQLMPLGSWFEHFLIASLSWNTGFLMSVLPVLLCMLCSHDLSSSWWFPLLSWSSSPLVLWFVVISSLVLAFLSAAYHALIGFAYVASHTSSSIASDSLLAILLMQVHDPSLLLIAPCSWSHSSHTDFHPGRPDSSWPVWSHPPGWSLLIPLPFSCIPLIHSSMYLCRRLDSHWRSQAMSNGDWHWWGWVLWMIPLISWWVLFSTHLPGCHLMPPWPCDPWGRSSCWILDLWLIHPGSWLDNSIWSTPMTAWCWCLIALYLLLVVLIPSPYHSQGMAWWCTQLIPRSPAYPIWLIAWIASSGWASMMGWLASHDQLMQRLCLIEWWLCRLDPCWCLCISLLFHNWSCLQPLISPSHSLEDLLMRWWFLGWHPLI